MHFPTRCLLFIPTAPTDGGIITACRGCNVKCPLPPWKGRGLKAGFSGSRHNLWGRFNRSVDFMNGSFIVMASLGDERKEEAGPGWKTGHWGCALKGVSWKVSHTLPVPPLCFLAATGWAAVFHALPPRYLHLAMDEHEIVLAHRLDHWHAEPKRILCPLYCFPQVICHSNRNFATMHSSARRRIWGGIERWSQSPMDPKHGCYQSGLHTACVCLFYHTMLHMYVACHNNPWSVRGFTLKRFRSSLHESWSSDQRCWCPLGTVYKYGAGGGGHGVPT